MLMSVAEKGESDWLNALRPVSREFLEIFLNSPLDKSAKSCIFFLLLAGVAELADASG